MGKITIRFLIIITALQMACSNKTLEQSTPPIFDPELTYVDYTPGPSDLVISRGKYYDQLYGFWLGQCIANWTGLVTEMDKIGNIGEIKTGDFYTRDDWGKPDQPSIWGEGIPSDLSPTIDFVFKAQFSILIIF